MKKMLAVSTILLAAAPMSASAQTLLDQMIQRIGKKKISPAAASAVTTGKTSVGANDVAGTFPLDVAGVRLGMSADEARAALTKAGYAISAGNGVSYGPSFAASVAAEAARRRTGAYSQPDMTDRVTTEIVGYGPHRETITVGLTPLAGGGSG